MIREHALPAIKSLPPEKEFGLVTWLRIFPTLLETDGYPLSVVTAAAKHLTENGVMIVSTAEADRETKDQLVKTVELIPKKIPGMGTKLIEDQLMASGWFFIVAGKKH